MLPDNKLSNLPSQILKNSIAGVEEGRAGKQKPVFTEHACRGAYGGGGGPEP